MINRPAARTAAGLLLLIGLVATPFLTDDQLEHQSAVITPPAPTFQIKWQAGQLALLGHTVSQRHEQRLLQVAESSYQHAAVQTTFEAFGVAPDGWEDLTIQIIYLLSEAESAMAEISATAITIRAVTADNLGWQSRLQAVSSILPGSIEISADVVVVDNSTNTAAICVQAVDAFEVGAINFEESSTVFRNSAFPRLDRAIALVTICDETNISIEGHTDATGPKSWNQDLSLKRANAVAEYFVRGGIDPDRIRALGFGSDSPIAENATRYGRGLNRRIEIDFQL